MPPQELSYTLADLKVELADRVMETVLLRRQLAAANKQLETLRGVIQAQQQAQLDAATRPADEPDE